MFDTAKNGTACLRLGSDDMVASILNYCCIGITAAAHLRRETNAEFENLNQHYK
jgi:hypothetical protein